MLRIGLARTSKEACELRPGIRCAHVDDADGLNPWPRRLNPEQARRFACLHAAPELLFGRQKQVLVERIGGEGDLHPFAAAGDYRKHRRSALVTHMLCCSCGIYFSAAASSEKAQGSMNLASKTAPVAFDQAVKGGRHIADQRVPDALLDVVDHLSGVALIPMPVQVLCDPPSWTMRFPDRSSGSASPRFSRQSRSRAASSAPMMIRASEPPMKCRRFML